MLRLAGKIQPKPAVSIPVPRAPHASKCLPPWILLSFRGGEPNTVGGKQKLLEKTQTKDSKKTK
jgi:hypothetical protein